MRTRQRGIENVIDRHAEASMAERESENKRKS